MTGPPPSRPSPLPAGLRGAIVRLLFALQVGLDLLVGLVAVLVWSVSAHPAIALVFLVALPGGYVVVFVVSTSRAADDRRSGRRSPVNWAVSGLLGSVGVTFVFFTVLTILGQDPAP